MDLAFEEAPRLISRWCNRLVDRLYDHSMLATESAEKHQTHEAIAALKKHMSTIEQGFGPALAQAVRADTPSGAVPGGGGAARSFSTLSFDELELMGDSQVQDTIDSARVQQIARLGCESGLADFSARLSTAQGFAVVKSDRNPLRPEVFAQTLIKQLQALPVDGALRSRWMIHGAQLLGDELQSLYLLLGGTLSRAGVAPAAYSVISAPEDKATRQRVAGAAAGQPAASGQGIPVAGDAVLTLDHLHRLLVGDYDESFPPEAAAGAALSSAAVTGADAGLAHAVPSAMDLLAGLQEKGLAAWQSRQLSAAPQPVVFKNGARTLGQSLALEVTGMMMAQMSSDERLLPPVRQFIAGIEPAFLRLAVADPRFFSDKGHPARRLLEAVTGKSLAYASESAPGFAQFMQDLKGISASLQDEGSSTAPQFAQLLASFEEQEARQAAQTSQAQSRAVQALLQAEQRNLMAEKIAAEIQARPDFVGGSRVITAFITGPWAQVMARERLLGEEGGPGARKAVYSLTLGDVLWSINIEQAARHRKRLVRIIPDMLQSVREGLLSIDYPLAQSKGFFDELMAIHQEALKPGAGAMDLRTVSRNRLEKEFEAGDQHVNNHWMAPTEAQDSGFMDDLGAQTKPGFEATEPLPLEAAEADPDAETFDSMQLKLGDWVELLSDTQWLRAQLTWMSPYYTLFMFTSQGGRQHSMTSRVLQHLLKIGLVKIVSQRGLVDGALDSVARAAMANSVSRSQY